MEIKHYLRIARRWGWILVLCIAAATSMSYWFTAQQPNVYEARARYLVGPALDNPLVTSNDLRASSQIGQTYAELVRSRPILQAAIDRLGLSISAGSLADDVTATWIDTTQILNIRVRASNPALAADIANALGGALIERSPAGSADERAAKHAELEAEIDHQTKLIEDLQGEIDTLIADVQRTTDPTAQRALIVRLDQQRDRLATAQAERRQLQATTDASATNQIAVLESAVPDPKVVSPKLAQSILAGLLAGLILGLAGMFLCEYFLGAVHTPEQLGGGARATYLGGIPRHSRLRGAGGAQLVTQVRPDTMEAESYRIVCATLGMGPDTYPQTLLVTSPAHGDGKTEIAANLAVSFANAGARVVLVDANLRRPRLARLFGLPERAGLADLGAVGEPAPEPLAVPAVARLRVVPAGRARLDGPELLGSQAMDQFMQRLCAEADIVIFDSPPLLYSDTLVLARRMSSVILVAWSGRTKAEALDKAVESLRQVGARRIGAVLNRIKGAPTSAYSPAWRDERVRGWWVPRRPPTIGKRPTADDRHPLEDLGDAAATALRLLQEAGLASTDEAVPAGAPQAAKGRRAVGGVDSPPSGGAGAGLPPSAAGPNGHH